MSSELRYGYLYHAKPLVNISVLCFPSFFYYACPWFYLGISTLCPMALINPCTDVPVPSGQGLVVVAAAVVADCTWIVLSILMLGAYLLNICVFQNYMTSIVSQTIKYNVLSLCPICICGLRHSRAVNTKTMYWKF